MNCGTWSTYLCWWSRTPHSLVPHLSLLVPFDPCPHLYRPGFVTTGGCPGVPSASPNASPLPQTACTRTSVPLSTANCPLLRPGAPKPLHFQRNKHLFTKFLPKIRGPVRARPPLLPGSGAEASGWVNAGAVLGKWPVSVIGVSELVHRPPTGEGAYLVLRLLLAPGV